MSNRPARRTPDPARLAIGRRLREARDRKGLSQHDVAMQLGVTAGAVGQWEVALTSPTMTNFDALLDILDVSREWLLTGDDPAGSRTAKTRNEAEILSLMRKLDGPQQASVLAMVEGLTRRVQ